MIHFSATTSMRIPSPTSTAPGATAAKPQPAGPAARPQAPLPDKVQDTNAARAGSLVASTTVRIPGLSNAMQRQAAAAGASAGDLTSMLQTSMKMNAIRNDPDMPESMKKALLQPLEQASKAMLKALDASAEQEEKAEMTEASTEDAQAIRQAGDDIAASRVTDDSPASAATDGVVPANGASAGDPARAAQADPDVQAPAPAGAAQAGEVSPVYSLSPPPPALGKTVDTRA